MKHIRSILATVLALAVILGICVLPASAAILDTSTLIQTEERTVIFVGDSRTTGMDQAVSGNPTTSVLQFDDFGIWSAKGGSRYDWFMETGLPNAEKYVGKNTSVVILMGYNDIAYESAQPSDYYEVINEKAKEWRSLGTDVYYVSVNPSGSVDSCPEKYAERNEKIKVWNETMQENLSRYVKYIDIYSQIQDSYVTLDNVHYDVETYFSIYNLIITRINHDHPFSARAHAEYAKG